VTVGPWTILIDHRERGSGVSQALERLGLSIEVVALDVGDYIVAERVGAERKTIRDLHRSIAERRLWRQVAGLRCDFHRAFLIIEGAHLDHGAVSREGVRGALLAVTELGVTVVRSAHPSDTALWLARIAARSQRTKPRRVSRSLPHGRPPTPSNILASLPGISFRAAESLLDRFGSIAGIAAATRTDLLDVPGVGERRADTLLELLSGGVSR